MHLLNVDKENYIGQADPFILKSQGRYYIYTTGHDGIYAYSSDSLFDGWKFEGMVLTDGVHDSWWAPSVIELDGKYYMYGTRGDGCWDTCSGFDVYVSDDLENWSEPISVFEKS